MSNLCISFGLFGAFLFQVRGRRNEKSDGCRDRQRDGEISNRKITM